MNNFNQDIVLQTVQNPDQIDENSHNFRNLFIAATAVGALGLAAACSGSGGTPNHAPVSSSQWSVTPVPGHTSPKTTAPTPKPTSSPTHIPRIGRIYPTHRVIATEFWVGETASDANAGIDNDSTEWESDAKKTLGGFDDPDNRTKDGLPLFKAKENPFYCALPMSEFNDDGVIKGVREASPWAKQAKSLPSDDSLSLFKGKNVLVWRTGSDKKTVCQLKDTGPSNDGEAVDDLKYVFGDGTQQPRNYPGIIKGAGIDLSPATAYSVFGESSQEISGKVEWCFIDKKDVPQGPWSHFPPINNRTHWD